MQEARALPPKITSPGIDLGVVVAELARVRIAMVEDPEGKLGGVRPLQRSLSAWPGHASTGGADLYSRDARRIQLP
jgi:hypothetical protein